MARWWLPFVAGCSFTHGTAPGDAGRDGSIDAPDAMIDAALPDASFCFTADKGIELCLAQMPSGTTTFSSNTMIDTTSSPMCAPLAGGDDACVIAGNSVVIDPSATVSATGSRPLVLIANVEIDVNGTIDVASHAPAATAVSGVIGPAADAASCDPGTPPTGTGGGAGGSHRAKGGNGGDENGAGGSHGTAGNTIPLAFHGGCPGQAGGTAGGAGGHGGGTTVLIAPTIVLGLNGRINASGAGGSGAGTGTTRGGGGGGSGGMVMLQAPTIMTSAGSQVFANGGGGGGGTNTTTAGLTGDDPIDAIAIPFGGAGGGNAGDGGNGTHSSMPPTNGSAGTNGSDGGGGGGGGAGFIHTQMGGMVMGPVVFSPMPT